MDIYEVIKKLAVECSEKDEKVKTAQEKLTEAEMRIAELNEELAALKKEFKSLEEDERQFANLYWRAAQKVPEEKEYAEKNWGAWFFDTI